MPEKKTLDRARKAKRSGKSASTQAGEFVREEIQHVREGKHGARTTKQAIAIGLNKARRSGVDLPAPKKGRASEKTRKSAQAARRKRRTSSSPERARAAERALRREGRSAAFGRALSRQARSSARRRGAADRSAAAKRAAGTEAFNLLPQDVGRPIGAFSATLWHPTLVEDLDLVLRTEKSIERETRDRSGKWYFMRILPYRARGTTDGVALTLIDIESLKAAEDALLRERHLLDSLMVSVPDDIFDEHLVKPLHSDDLDRLLSAGCGTSPRATPEATDCLSATV